MTLPGRVILVRRATATVAIGKLTGALLAEEGWEELCHWLEPTLGGGAGEQTHSQWGRACWRLCR